MQWLAGWLVAVQYVIYESLRNGIAIFHLFAFESTIFLFLFVPDRLVWSLAHRISCRSCHNDGNCRLYTKLFIISSDFIFGYAWVFVLLRLLPLPTYFISTMIHIQVVNPYLIVVDIESSIREWQSTIHTQTCVTRTIWKRDATNFEHENEKNNFRCRLTKLFTKGQGVRVWAVCLCVVLCASFLFTQWICNNSTRMDCGNRFRFNAHLSVLFFVLFCFVL